MILIASITALAPLPDLQQAEPFVVWDSTETYGLGAAIVVLDDVDGDGVRDLALGRSRDGNAAGDPSAFVVSGATGETLWAVKASNWWEADFGATLAAPGDLDGDCTTDLLVGTPTDMGDPTNLDNFLWTLSGSTGRRLGELRGNQIRRRDGGGNDGFASSACPGGDLDGDGVADFWVGSRVALDGVGEYLGMGRVQAFSGLTGEELRRFEAPEGGVAGHFLVGMGDIDGDGLEDVCTVGTWWSSWLYHLSGRDAVPRATVQLDSSSQTASPSRATAIVARATAIVVTAVVNVGDVDGDETPDVAVAWTLQGNGVVALLSLATGTELGRLDWPAAPRAGFGAALAALPDLDGDGIGELAVGAPYFDGGRGRVEVRSPGSGREIFSHDGERGDGRFGSALAASDLDGDGVWELIVGAPGEPTRQGNPGAGAVHVLSLRGACR